MRLSPVAGQLTTYAVQFNILPGTKTLEIPVGQRNGSYGGDFNHWLSEGVYLLSFSWDGPESVEVTAYKRGRWRSIMTIPAGSGGEHRESPQIVYSAVGPELRIAAALGAIPADTTYSGSLQVTKLPPVS